MSTNTCESPDTPAPASAEEVLPATGPFAAAPNAKDTSAEPPTGAKGPAGALTRPTDHATRPGFRSKPNVNSKAQKPAPKRK